VVQNTAAHVGVKGVPNGMKGIFEGLLQKNRKSYKLLFSMAGMTETSAANHGFKNFNKWHFTSKSNLKLLFFNF
jgi:hypothetical protein